MTKQETLDILQEIKDLESYEIADAKYSNEETRKYNVDILVEEFRSIVKRHCEEPIESEE